MPTVSEAIAAKESVEADILKRPGVTGVDVGFKYVDGQRTNEIAVRVHVARKRDVPAAQQIPPTIAGVRTDVIQRVFVLHQQAPIPGNRKPVEAVEILADTNHYPTLRGGASIGPCRSVGGFVFAGTLGAIVTDNTNGAHMLLSNFHVMCVDNGWHVGDQMCQPSRVDTGACPADVVGTLQRAVLDASVDAAICSVSGRPIACEIIDIGAVAGTAAATLNAPIRKRGRTTALTHGFVDSVSLSVNVDYGDGIGMRTLTGQIGIRPDTAQNPKFGDHGDSGSVVVNDTQQVVGLYFAGSDDGFGTANPIAAVLSALNITMCTGLATLPILDAPGPTAKFQDDPTLKFRDDPTVKFRDDPTLKFQDDPTLKFRDDPTVKFQDDPTLKFRDDPTVKFQDDGPTTKVLDDTQPKSPVADQPGPGGPGPDPGPFVLSTPHHSMAWAQTYPAAFQAELEQLQMTMAEYEQMLTEMQVEQQRGQLSPAEQQQMQALQQEYQQLLAQYQQMTQRPPGG